MQNLPLRIHLLKLNPILIVGIFSLRTNEAVVIRRCSPSNIPVLVEATFAFFTQMLSPNCFESTKTSRRLDVTNNSYAYHWRCFNNCNRLYNFFLVHFWPRPISFSHNMWHTSFKSQEGSQMWLLTCIIFREGLNLTSMTRSTFFRQESNRSMAGSLKFSVRLKRSVMYFNVEIVANSIANKITMLFFIYFLL